MKLFLKDLTTSGTINKRHISEISISGLIFKISDSEWDAGISIIYEEVFTLHGMIKRASRRTLMLQTVESGIEL
jgi:hypothetical protein